MQGLCRLSRPTIHLGTATGRLVADAGWHTVPHRRRGSRGEAQDASLHPVSSGPSNDPLHGLTLEVILTRLLAIHGWDGLARHVDVRCFKLDPSIKSSLTFLRRTPWARKQVEDLFLASLGAR